MSKHHLVTEVKTSLLYKVPVQYHCLHLVPVRLDQRLGYCITDLKFWLPLMITENLSMLKFNFHGKASYKLMSKTILTHVKTRQLKLERKKQVKECIINHTRSTHDRIFQYPFVWHWPIPRELDYQCTARKWLLIVTFQCECQMCVQFHQHFQQWFHFLSNKWTSHYLKTSQLSMINRNYWVNIITSLHNKYNLMI